MNEPMIICLGAGHSQLPLIDAAHQLGFRVVAIDRNPQAPGMAAADACIVESTHDSEAVIARLRKYDHQYHGLLARTCGLPLVTAARICKSFGIAGLTTPLVELVIRKSSLRRFAAAHKTPAPLGWGDQLPPAGTDYPLIVKPDLTVVGKKGVAVVRNKAGLVPAMAEARQCSGNGLAEVESFVEGCDVTWLTLLEQGRSCPMFAIDELVGINPQGAIKGLGVSLPSITSGTKSEGMMLRMMEEFALLFPDVRAILAFSFRIDRRQLQPQVIEIHADLTGDLILDVLLPNAYQGQNVLRRVAAVALGGPPFRLLPEAARPTAIRYTGDTHEIVQGDSMTKILQEIQQQAGGFAFSHPEMANTL